MKGQFVLSSFLAFARSFREVSMKKHLHCSSALTAALMGALVSFCAHPENGTDSGRTSNSESSSGLNGAWDDHPSSTSSMPSPTTNPVETTSSSSGTTSILGETASTSSSEGEVSTGAPEIIPCETWADECPDGMKCIPFSSQESDYFDSQGCFPMASEAAGLGGACESLDLSENILDTCEKHMFCWGLVCEPLCQGTPQSLVCPSGFACATINRLAVCLPTCDPRLPCPESGDTCVASVGGVFECVERHAEQELFSSCADDEECVLGTFCGYSFMADECFQDISRCCIAYCDTDQPFCPGAGQQCQPYGGLPNDIPEYQNLGYCSI